MAKFNGVEFTVIGRGKFPFDMLRYDACYPKNSMDAYSLDFDWDAADRGKREVVLISSQPNAPTTGRWESFGWTIVSETKL